MKRNYLILLIALTLLLYQAVIAQPAAAGRNVYEQHCVRCHGKDGTRGQYGAKNLQTSILNDAELQTIIRNGKRIMPSWKKKLSAEQITLVTDYIKSLRVSVNQ